MGLEPKWDSDIVLLGTGVAPLLAAARFLSEGYKVLILNPDGDFFRERSELPLDPLLTSTGEISATRLSRSLPERVTEVIRPFFPGAIETWLGNETSTGASGGTTGFKDPMAPHVRARSRFWIDSDTFSLRERNLDWPRLEELYVEASDAGLHPQILQELTAIRRFPGVNRSSREFESSYHGLWVPRICDVDVVRYQYGLLEYVRERIGGSRMVTSASQVEWIPEGVRFFDQGQYQTARISKGAICFWTPRLTRWIHGIAKKLEATIPQPGGVRVWEDWTLVSRDALDPSVVGVFEDMTVFASYEGAPKDPNGVHALRVLRPGAVVGLEQAMRIGPEQTAGGLESFRALERLCGQMLRWSAFSVRSFEARVLLEWDYRKLAQPMFRLGGELSKWNVMGGADGPLFEVAHQVRKACNVFEETLS
ncbi:MAG: hypothetical protein JNL01_17065 [Bdellovibrionales bacterium]|nr:hypothetical protein [Bdellovibrionales bacterium]